MNNRTLLYIHFVVWGFYLFSSTISHPKEFFVEFGWFYVFLKQFTMLVAVLIPFYINYLYLVEKYFFKKRYLFFLIFQLILLILGLISGYFESIFSDYYLDIGAHFSKYYFEDIPYQLFHIISYLIISVASKLFFEFINQKNRILELELEQKKTELKLLRFQVNPHFLFNTLNSLYSKLILKEKNSEEIIIKLSNVFQYQLIENNGFVVVEDETEFINDFIELQKLRLVYPSIVKVHFEVLTNGTIPHMLLIPFVENCFKHGDLSEEGSIEITIKTIGSDFLFESKNRVSKFKNSISNNIGIKNVQKRLDLIYNQDYTLTITRKEEFFNVLLIIRLL